MNDPRLTPARSDLAAAKLKGQVNADRFVEAVRKQMKSGVSPLRETPSHLGRLETQLLLGETFDVYDERDGWAWGQKYLQDGVAVIEAPVGKGKLFLFGPEITFRAQPHGTFKFLFNGIYYGRAEAVKW
mgnify:CR=1 FL=1